MGKFKSLTTKPLNIPESVYEHIVNFSKVIIFSEEKSGKSVIIPSEF